MSYPYYPQQGPNDPPPSRRRPQLPIPPPTTTYTNTKIQGTDFYPTHGETGQQNGFPTHSGGYITYPPPAGQQTGVNLAWHPYNGHTSAAQLAQERANAEALASQYWSQNSNFGPGGVTPASNGLLMYVLEFRAKVNF
jgi:hypothetical protein